MFQGSPDYFCLQQNDTNLGPSTGTIGFGVHSTPNSKNTESEASFDSGYLSPATTAAPSGSFIPLTSDHFFNNPPRPSPSQQKVLQKVQLDDEWDKKFIENFEANLFGIDPSEDFSSEDLNLFSELLSSPVKSGLSPAGLFHGHSPAKYSRSPLKNLFSSPKSLNTRRVLTMNDNWNNNNGQTTFCTPADPQQLTVMSNSPALTVNAINSQNENYILDQRLSTHDYAKPNTISYSAPAVATIPQENMNFTRLQDQITEPMSNFTVKIEPALQNPDIVPELLPTKQKLQYVRAKFKQTLQKAVENADNAAINEEKYPQLTKRLSKLTSNIKQEETSRKENFPSSLTETPPCTQTSSSLSAFDIADANTGVSQAAPKRFRELAPAPSGKRTFACIVNNQYEMKQQSDCRIVIKKRKTY